MTEMIYGAVAAPVKPREASLGRWWDTIDRGIFTAIIVLFVFGILLGMAASQPLAARNGLSDFYYVTRQLIFGGLAFIAMVVISHFNAKQVRRAGVFGFLFCFLILLALPLIGTDFGKGAVRWLSFGFVSVQPSEFLKPGFVVFAAWLIAIGRIKGAPPGRSIAFAITSMIIILLALQPDYGQAALILLSWGAMMFVGGTPLLLLIGAALIAITGSHYAYNHSEHVARRINGFLSGEIDANTQLAFAGDAIRNGGFFGVGVGEGEVKFRLPDAHTDFIIAVAAEEYGVVLCWLITACFTYIVLRAFNRLRQVRDPFVRIAGTGMCTMIALQSMINLGVAARLLPAKGMTLPFVSYGGSSLLAMGITFGFLLALTRLPDPGFQGGYGPDARDGRTGFDPGFNPDAPDS